MNKIKTIINKNIEIIMYIIIGICTTLINLVTYTCLYKFLKVDINLSNLLSIIAAIIFAFFANKIFVFKSKNNTIKKLFLEIVKFISARIFTMIIEIYGVYFFVIINNENELVGKIKIQIFVLILNYLMSKFIIFKK